MNEFPIRIEGLVKYFDGRCIIDSMDLKIPRGSIYGLLGRNGAGKTTLIRILLGLEEPTRGQALVFDVPGRQLTARQKHNIGYVAEGHHLIGYYTPYKLMTTCRAMCRKWDMATFNKLQELFNIPMDRKIKQLSTGMRAQLNLAMALAMDPELLILDDPTLGLDTIVRRQFLELAIEVIQKEGRTILFSSHILGDVERISDRIGVLVAGKLVVDCELEELKRRIRKFRVIFPETPPDELYLTEIIHTQRQGRELHLTAANWNPQKHKIIETFNPETIVEVPMSLEDIFIECTTAANGDSTSTITQ
jgi:ABC-2 type transport system ATP-binding protein